MISSLSVRSDTNTPLLLQNAEQPLLQTPKIVRHVVWIKDKMIKNKAATIAFLILEIALLSLSLIGIYFITQGFSINKAMNKEFKFHNKPMGPPPPFDSFNLPNKTRCFNHTHFYAIHQGTIWYRPRYQNPNSNAIVGWKRLYFAGVPRLIKTDGANLVTINDKNQVRYRKVINEKMLTNSQGEHEYKWWDLHHIDDWRKQWFSLPVFRYLNNLYCDRLLKLPEDTLDWAISHRGHFNHLLEDCLGRNAIETFGCTQLYVLGGVQGSQIQMFDPWIVPKAKNIFVTPATKTSNFQGIHLEAAASTVMLLGYQVKQNSDGIGIKKTLQIQTVLKDIDTLGWNPGIKYDYEGANLSKVKKNTRFLMYPDWKNHPLDLVGQAAVTNIISIQQTGIGNQARELRVEGRNEEGYTGFYVKNIAEEQWQFHRDDHDIDPGDYLENEMIDHNQQFVPIIHDYGNVNNKLIISNKDLTGVHISLNDFGLLKYDANIRIEHKGQFVDLTLNRRKTVLNFVGKKGLSVEIVKPPKDRVPVDMRPIMKKIFGKKRILPVNLKSTENIVIVSSKLFSNKFKMHFSKVNPQPT